MPPFFLEPCPDDELDRELELDDELDDDELDDDDEPDEPECLEKNFLIFLTIPSDLTFILESVNRGSISPSTLV